MSKINVKDFKKYNKNGSELLQKVFGTDSLTEFENTKIKIKTKKDSGISILLDSLPVGVNYIESGDSYVLTGWLTSIAIVTATGLSYEVIK